MKKDKALEELFLAQKPHFSDKADFMAALTKRLDAVEFIKQHQELYLALRTLPPKERSAITLFYLNGYNIKEIAVITETSEDAVKKQLSRGRDKLKEKLKL